jgi:hypothetical protein
VEAPKDAGVLGSLDVARISRLAGSGQLSEAKSATIQVPRVLRRRNRAAAERQERQMGHIVHYARSLLLLLLIAVFQAGMVSALQTTAIIGATRIDGTAHKAVPAAAIVIQGYCIATVGPRSRVTIPPGAMVIDAAGTFMTPRIIDNNIRLILFIAPKF